MENEILENGTAPEVEVQPTVEVQETVVVEPQQTVTVEPTAKTTKFDVKDNVITTNLKKVADKGKELISDPKALWTKIKAVPKKIWIIAGGALVALIAAIVAFTLLSNTYKTPINLMEDMKNAKKAESYMDNKTAQLNGFCEDEYENIQNILKKADDYEEDLEHIEDDIDEEKDLYGDNYKYSYQIVKKEKLTSGERKAMRETIRTKGRLLENKYDDWESEDYVDLGDDLGISKAQAKKLVKYKKEIAETMAEARVEEGYRLTVELTITGSEVDDPKPQEMTITVYKVDGRWVSYQALMLLLNLT